MNKTFNLLAILAATSILLLGCSPKSDDSSSSSSSESEPADPTRLRRMILFSDIVFNEKSSVSFLSSSNSKFVCRCIVFSLDITQRVKHRIKILGGNCGLRPKNYICSDPAF